jgi:hypothetical protein
LVFELERLTISDHLSIVRFRSCRLSKRPANRDWHDKLDEVPAEYTWMLKITIAICDDKCVIYPSAHRESDECESRDEGILDPKADHPHGIE